MLFFGPMSFLLISVASRMSRSLLSIDNLVTEDGISLKPSVFLLVAGAVILVIAGSLCTGCNKTKDDESM